MLRGLILALVLFPVAARAEPADAEPVPPPAFDLLALAEPGPDGAGPDGPRPVPLGVRVAGGLGMGFAIGLQAHTLGLAIAWSAGGPETLMSEGSAFHLANALMAAPGVLGFAGVATDGTPAGLRRGLGVGFLEGGIYSLSMTGVLVAGLLRAPHWWDTVLFAEGSAVVFGVVGAAFTPLGIVLLATAERGSPKASATVLPILAPGPTGLSVGLVGRF